MATSTLSNRTSPANIQDTLEDASADMCVCDTMILAVDNFVDEIRIYAAPNDGIRPDEYVFRPALHAMTMLDQARDQLQEAKLKIDTAVSACVASRKNGAIEPARQAWENALAEYRHLRAISDGITDDDDKADAAIDAYCLAMDRLINETPAPDASAIALKLELALERTVGGCYFGSDYAAAVKRDVEQLAA